MKKGFSLVELLVVLVVIGIILAIVLPNTLKAIEQANIRDTAAALKSIDTAIQVCYSETRDWGECSDIPGLIADGYLENMSLTSPFDRTYSIQTNGDGGASYSDKEEHFSNWPDLSSRL